MAADWTMSEKSLEKVTVDLGRLKVLDCVHHKGPQTSGETEKSSGGQWKVAASPPTPAAHCESKGNQLLVQLDSVALAAADPTPVIFSGWHKLALMFVFFMQIGRVQSVIVTFARHRFHVSADEM